MVIRYCNIPEETDTLEATQGLPEADGLDNSGRGWGRYAIPVDAKPVCISPKRMSNMQPKETGTIATYCQRHKIR